jgi:hypothetical protein
LKPLATDKFHAWRQQHFAPCQRRSTELAEVA